MSKISVRNSSINPGIEEATLLFDESGRVLESTLSIEAEKQLRLPGGLQLGEALFRHSFNESTLGIVAFHLNN